jgi:hypothetical protein
MVLTWNTNWFAKLVNEYKLYVSIQKFVSKVRKMQNLGNVYIWGSPFVMSRTDAQNGADIIFNSNGLLTEREVCTVNYISFVSVFFVRPRFITSL